MHNQLQAVSVINCCSAICELPLKCMLTGRHPNIPVKHGPENMGTF